MQIKHSVGSVAILFFYELLETIGSPSRINFTPPYSLRDWSKVFLHTPFKNVCTNKRNSRIQTVCRTRKSSARDGLRDLRGRRFGLETPRVVADRAWNPCSTLFRPLSSFEILPSRPCDSRRKMAQRYRTPREKSRGMEYHLQTLKDITSPDALLFEILLSLPHNRQ